MTWRARLSAAAMALAIGACATAPTPIMPADEDYDPEAFVVPPPTPLVESPPIEPVEPPTPPVSSPATPADPVAPEAPAQPPLPQPPTVVVIPVPSMESTEDQQLLGLLSDLQRYGTLQADELRRELNGATQALARARTDVNRVRLAVLYTLLRTSPQDDQRALQLFENVAKNAAPASSIRHLAGVLQAQVTERQRAVRDEQQKADAAIQKLEALRAMERSLLRDRVRSGGGGGAAGQGGSGR